MSQKNVEVVQRVAAAFNRKEDDWQSVSRHDAMVYTLRAGKIAEIVYHNDQQQALEAVGLRE
jgi:ketosteroid isomerase-like protein